MIILVFAIILALILGYALGTWHTAAQILKDLRDSDR